MDEVFFKSALPAQDSFVLDDTSLALPTEPNPRSLARVHSNDRSLRVHQQVQLTLARRTRRTLSSGSVHLQKTSKSPDTTDELLPNLKVNAFSVTPRSLSSSHLRRPSRRVEVSRPPSPEYPRTLLHRFGTFTFPSSIQANGPSTAPHPSLGWHLHQRYAFSESPRGTRLQASTSTHGRNHHKSVRQVVGQHTTFGEAAFQQSGNYGSRWSQNHTVVKREAQVENRQMADATLAASQPEKGQSLQAEVRREVQGLRRRNSHPPSMTSVEVDLTKPMEVEPPVQQMQINNVMAMKAENKIPEMTIERAVNLLTQDNEETLICAANYLQNQCFKSADAKKMVFYLHGIEKLLQLLSSDSEEVQHAAAGALRNVVFQSNENKMEVKENTGLAKILRALKSSRDTETRRQLTGLLWNLSSHDLLKERLSRQALPVLTQSVLVPSSGISEGENPKDDLLADNEVFHNATGCLRNLSSAGPDGRRAMRDCENLIDSLVYYVRGTIADYKADDKSAENCVCILHNLSYQIEAELPKKYFKDFGESQLNLAPKPKSLGCFTYRSAKITEHLEQQCPLLEEKANPRGIEWLWSAITIRMYLSLMARSVRHHTQEAAMGALQNITAGHGVVTEAIAHTIVQRENGLHHIRKMLQEGERDVKITAVSLIKNLSRYRTLHPDIVKQVLPEVVEMIPSDDTELPTEATVSLCNILVNLSQTDTQNVRAIVNHGALPKVISISKLDSGYGPTRASQAACLLLHTMWKHTDLHGAFRKCGYRKTSFINARTTRAVNLG
ncbi:LOW QUALITY PROTEIN: plakophilin-2 [Thalassophryne amazonica]|uniref:LOW QUALITY PROTEIN: plakophilin-2 n=1 Tax=Thalassophryne amazonica TaxID=390379 RepID=UPI0014725AF8|nr:LOW QUALITY PROTEIN: plakophilin-2 [Thalassophryne amazonica]